MAEYLLKLLRENSLTLGCAESCTGGLVANRFVTIPGASDVFKGSVTAYATEIKTALLDVPQTILDEHGAVSPECAEAMALGCARRLNCNCAVSTTGVAGPDGGTPEKPVGLVYVGACVNGRSITRKLQLRGGRRIIRERAVENALILLFTLLTTAGNDSSC